MDVSPSRRPRPSEGPGEVVAGTVGGLIGAVFGVVGKLRRARPLHPRGRVYRGTLVVDGSPRPWGVPLLDRPARTECLVRVSRSMGLPAPLPDIHGIAIRAEHLGRSADLLFATTGTNRLLRYVLLTRRSEHAAMTMLFPVRTPAGPLQLRLSPAEGAGRVWDLSAAAPKDRHWQPVGRLVADEQPVAPDPDPPIRFEPVHNLPAGIEQYPWLAAVRDPSYVYSRRWSPASTWRSDRGA